MTIPTTGPYNSETVRSEWGFTVPFTSAQVASAAGLTVHWTSEQLRGKSARTVSVRVISHEQVRTGFDHNERYYDRITFDVKISDNAVPSSYSWGGNVFGTASTAVFTGQEYRPFEWTRQEFGVADCSVVIGTQTYVASTDFQYTTGNEIS